MKNEEIIGTFDCTPTWSAILPMTLEAYKKNVVILSTYKHGSRSLEEKVGIIEAELKNMAIAADKWNEHCKQVIKNKSN